MMLISCLRSSFRKFNRCEPLKANSNPPFSPFVKGGISSAASKPLFGKEGKGRFSPEVASNYVADFWVTPRGRVTTIASATLLILALSASCDRLPGKPDEAARWRRPTEVVDFNQLYAQNCSGCHGAEGRLGAARPLNDPLYLALVNDETLHQVIAHGVPKTMMPAFEQKEGGNLTDAQLKVLVQGIRSEWARSGQVKTGSFPPYGIGKNSMPGDPRRGSVVYQTYCAQCHEADGRGHAKAGSILDPNYLTLVSDQSLRTTVIAGRSDLGKPDWRDNVPGRPMSPQEISDVVAWIASHREKVPSSGFKVQGYGEGGR